MTSSELPLPSGIDLAVQGIQGAVWDLRGLRSPPVHPHVRVGQALFWICSFDEQHREIDGYKEHRDSTAHGQVIEGLRFARNAVTHGVVPLAKVVGEDFKLPGARLTVGQWTWRTREEIVADWTEMKPKLNNEAMLSSYDQWTAGKRIEAPILTAYEWVKQWTKSHYGVELA
ncbi:hypothetical protein [Arthrobacter sp. SRS-W-1-2016]|uniref:hypothetical protein n=1 Tax=Arthrobacter sp. SRS-W-1-2016 TaxID=1930254 RepID=UPI001116DA46|nr:hypothetical protein [Arthrobacter sp. SRS-W-1-2016]